MLAHSDPTVGLVWHVLPGVAPSREVPLSPVRNSVLLRRSKYSFIQPWNAISFLHLRPGLLPKTPLQVCALDTALGGPVVCQAYQTMPGCDRIEQGLPPPWGWANLTMAGRYCKWWPGSSREHTCPAGTPLVARLHSGLLSILYVLV